MSDNSCKSVWDALEDSTAQSTEMKLRSDLMIAISEEVKKWKQTQTVAAGRLGVTQPRLNDLLKGKISKFNLEALIGLAESAGLKVEISAEPRELASSGPV